MRIASQTQKGRAVPSLIPLYPQTARVLGVSRGAVFRAASRGELPLFSMGRRKLVIVAKLAELIGRPITLHDLS